MKSKQIYETPSVEELYCELNDLIAASNLENPVDGGDWNWDD